MRKITRIVRYFDDLIFLIRRIMIPRNVVKIENATINKVIGTDSSYMVPGKYPNNGL
ncbi:MAG: hypothetical protein K9I99_17600 [Melioribacteraceae bacterium]|nr:hypothetical protein [Melioribacteraceae bacterium]